MKLACLILYHDFQTDWLGWHNYWALSASEPPPYRRCRRCGKVQIP